MDRQAQINEIKARFVLLDRLMDRDERRLWAAAEAMTLGRGGIAMVEEATEIRHETIEKGIAQLKELNPGLQRPLPGIQRFRRPVGGRKKLTQTDPSLLEDLNALVDPVTQRDQNDPLRWSTKGTRELAEELNQMDHPISDRTVAAMLKEQGYSLRTVRESRRQGDQFSAAAQFQHINQLARAFRQAQQPVIYVEATGKKLIEVNKVPADEGVAQWQARIISNWWGYMGRGSHPGANTLLIICESNRYLELELQKLADKTRLTFVVCDFPPGTTKWNQIEQQMGCQISGASTGESFVTCEVIVSIIESTAAGKTVHQDTGSRCPAADHAYRDCIIRPKQPKC